jgi:hypothetical protein
MNAKGSRNAVPLSRGRWCQSVYGVPSARIPTTPFSFVPFRSLALAATGGSLLERVRRILRVPTTDAPPSTRQDRTALTYSILRAGFDFIEARYGKAGVRQLLLVLRNTSNNLSEDAFYLTRDQFDRAFEEYLLQWVTSRN